MRTHRKSIESRVIVGEFRRTLADLPVLHPFLDVLNA